MSELTQKKCLPCEGIGEVLTAEQAQALQAQTPEWQVDAESKMISRELVVKNFAVAIDFINEVAKIAEVDNHHPDVHLTSFRNIKIDLMTHALGGLSENDFILAAKIDQIPVELKDV